MVYWFELMQKDLYPQLLSDSIHIWKIIINPLFSFTQGGSILGSGLLRAGRKPQQCKSDHGWEVMVSEKLGSLKEYNHGEKSWLGSHGEKSVFLKLGQLAIENVFFFTIFTSLVHWTLPSVACSGQANPQWFCGGKKWVVQWKIPLVACARAKDALQPLSRNGWWPGPIVGVKIKNINSKMESKLASFVQWLSFR